MKRPFFLILLLLVGCQTSVTLEPSLINTNKPATANTIPHFAVVDSKLQIYRGGQPDQAGFKFLKSLGVERIIKLNLESEGSDGPAEELGLSVLRYPIDDFHQEFGPVTQPINDAAQRALAGKVYIHCEHGQDRTGAVCYQVRRLMGWAPEKARAEAISMGIHWELMALWYYVKNDMGSTIITQSK